MHAAYMNVFPALLGAYIDRLGAVPSKNYNPPPLVFICGTLNYASAGADSGRKKQLIHEPINPANLYNDGNTKARWVQQAKLQST